MMQMATQLTAPDVPGPYFVHTPGKRANELACNEEVAQFMTARGGGGSAQKKLIGSLQIADAAKAKPKPPPSRTLTTPPPLPRRHVMWDLMRPRDDDEEEEELLAELQAGRLSAVDHAAREQFLRKQVERAVHQDVLASLVDDVVVGNVSAAAEDALHHHQDQYEQWARGSLLRHVKIAACRVAPDVHEVIGYYGPGDRDWWDGEVEEHASPSPSPPSDTSTPTCAAPNLAALAAPQMSEAADSSTRSVGDQESDRRMHEASGDKGYDAGLNADGLSSGDAPSRAPSAGSHSSGQASVCAACTPPAIARDSHSTDLDQAVRAAYASEEASLLVSWGPAILSHEQTGNVEGGMMETDTRVGVQPADQPVPPSRPAAAMPPPRRGWKSGKDKVASSGLRGRTKPDSRGEDWIKEQAFASPLSRWSGDSPYSPRAASGEGEGSAVPASSSGKEIFMRRQPPVDSASTASEDTLGVPSLEGRGRNAPGDVAQTRAHEKGKHDARRADALNGVKGAVDGGIAVGTWQSGALEHGAQDANQAEPSGGDAFDSAGDLGGATTTSADDALFADVSFEDLRADYLHIDAENTCSLVTEEKAGRIEVQKRCEVPSVESSAGDARLQKADTRNGGRTEGVPRIRGIRFVVEPLEHIGNGDSKEGKGAGRVRPQSAKFRNRDHREVAAGLAGARSKTHDKRHTEVESSKFEAARTGSKAAAAAIGDYNCSLY